MKIKSLEDFQRALKMIELGDLEVKLVQIESDISSIGVPRLLIEGEEHYKRFCDVIWESFSQKEFLIVPLNSDKLELVYRSSHWPRICSQVFKALEDSMWRKKVVKV